MAARSASLFAAPPGALAVVLAAYVVALGAGAAVVAFAPSDTSLFVTLAIADVAATIVVFAFSRAFNNTSFYDSYWMVAPIVFVSYLGFGPAAPGALARKLTLCALVWLWGARLTWAWLRYWEGFHYEDWRYVHFRKTWGRGYWLGSFAVLHLFPTVATYLGSLPLFYAATSTAPLGVLDGLAFLVTAGSITIEALADRQLRAHRDAQAGAGSVCETGLWRYSRHPNYFGECGFWCGLWLFGLATGGAAAWWTGAGFALIVCMFVFGTIPMAEQRALSRRPQFAEHQRRVSMLVPWFRATTSPATQPPRTP